MDILEHLDKNNLHHAYLLEGAEKEIVPEILKFMKNSGIETSGNPDFFHMSFDSFRIEDARNLKSMEYEKGFSTKKKIFLISANNFLLEAQNTLLKIFEEPIENTHFFIITPDVNILLKTLVSRFYLIRTKAGLESELKEAEKFIAMPVKNRLDFIKELLAEAEEDEENQVEIQSTRAKALKFLNALEIVLHKKFLKKYFEVNPFSQIFKVREFLSQPGSSAKSLMESVALTVPNF
jgi:DNA polymerase III delta prime subunit